MLVSNGNVRLHLKSHSNGIAARAGQLEGQIHDGIRRFAAEQLEQVCSNGNRDHAVRFGGNVHAVVHGGADNLLSVEGQYVIHLGHRSGDGVGVAYIKVDIESDGQASVADCVDESQSLRNVEVLSRHALAQVDAEHLNMVDAVEIEGAKVTAMQDMGILVETLKTGGLDALILDEPVAKNYAAGGQFTVLEGALIDEETHIIAKEGNTELMDAVNKALAAFLESDECAALKEKYGL